MNKYLISDSWNIIEEGFHENKQLESESIFSLGNGFIGQRGNFEEYYSGTKMIGSYVAGVYYPEPAEHGVWKNGYADTNDKIVNAPNWNIISVRLNDDRLDLATWDVRNFKRTLNMREGYLERTFEASNFKGHRIQVTVRRFLSMSDTELAAISYSVKSLNFDGHISFLPLIDGDVRNKLTNYDEPFWNILQTKTEKDVSHLWAQTRKIDFHVCAALTFSFYKNNELINVNPTKIEKEKVAGFSVGADIRTGDTVSINKYVAVLSSLNHPREELTLLSRLKARKARETGWNALFEAHTAVWEQKWKQSDVIIDGDVEAQQAIRFSIFQLNQTYQGDDPRHNISPKGFTGEKYGGATRWDTEAVCVPFYLCTAPQHVARNLLLYRYRHLGKAIQNASKLGFNNQAALFPMSTFNGSESHNEWELSFGEVHRNGMVAFAIYNYIRYTGDESYMAEYGLRVLLSIARFWAQRVSVSDEKKKYVILGVVGPNGYESNVNNNWFTNYIACWCLKYTIESLEAVKTSNFVAYEDLTKEYDFSLNEIKLWKEIINNMYFQENKKSALFIQQGGYLDKTLIKATDIPLSQLPVNQHWTWDKIVRSSVIKQADVVQGLYFFEDHFDQQTIATNFNFYEPLTVHESSISASIHSIVANAIGENKRAYDLYLRTARLDLDDYNNEVAEGLHITSMAGTWLAIVQGFGGLRVRNGKLSLKPHIPEKWISFAFNIRFRTNQLNIRIEKERVIIQNIEGNTILLEVNGKEYVVEAGKHTEI